MQEPNALFGLLQRLNPIEQAGSGDQVRQIVQQIQRDGQILDLSAKDAEGNTVLHIATLKGHPDIIQALLTAGAKKDIRNSAGLSVTKLALQECEVNQRPEMWFVVEMLMDEEKYGGAKEAAESAFQERIDKRKSTLDNFVIGFLDYMDHLNAANEIKIALELTTKTKLVTSIKGSVVQILFGGFDNVLTSTRAIADAIKNSVEHQTINEDLGHIFLNNADAFRVYTSYVVHGRDRHNLIKKHERGDTSLYRFLQACQLLPQYKTYKPALSDFFNRPGRKIQQLPFELDNVLNDSGSMSQNSKQVLQDAITHLKAVCSAVNGKVEEYQKQKLAQEHQPRFFKHKEDRRIGRTVVKYGRLFLHNRDDSNLVITDGNSTIGRRLRGTAGRFQEWARSTSVMKKRSPKRELNLVEMCLFNDVLAHKSIARTGTVNKRSVYRVRLLDINSVNMTSINIQGKNYSAFEVQTDISSPFIFYIPAAKERDEWFDAISSAQTKLLEVKIARISRAPNENNTPTPRRTPSSTSLQVTGGGAWQQEEDYSQGSTSVVPQAKRPTLRPDMFTPQPTSRPGTPILDRKFSISFAKSPIPHSPSPASGGPPSFSAPRKPPPFTASNPPKRPPSSAPPGSPRPPPRSALPRTKSVYPSSKSPPLPPLQRTTSADRQADLAIAMASRNITSFVSQLPKH